MTRLALCLLLLATGASAEQLTLTIEVIHDDKRGVTCWVYSGFSNRGGISCIPDSQLQPGELRQDLQHQHDTTPTPTQAPAPWNEERYSL